MAEARNDIFEEIKMIEDIESEEGQKLLEDVTERFEATFNQEGDNEDGISDQHVILTKMPWATLESASDKAAL